MVDQHTSPGTPAEWHAPEPDPAELTHAIHEGLGLLALPMAVLLMFGAWSPTVFVWAPTSPLAAAVTAAGFLAAAVLAVAGRSAGRRAVDLTSVVVLAGLVGLAVTTALHLRELGRMDPLGPLTISRTITLGWVPAMVVLPVVLVRCIRTVRRAGLPPRGPSWLLRVGGTVTAAPLLGLALASLVDPARTVT
ncbi:hypothetical protein [Nocardioides jiangxiensis]|uniref:Uncharacterized protein n=1 Tax=Nocardioides jiangxiensis TaxID=3064524 RepID=A0ABT9AZT6_9ACTN|nr:hypothetical protein [Nocardioides sp. WY-20]MDO7867645.1 hypothetical protein [Nocardioides sp. WY-20]